MTDSTDKPNTDLYGNEIGKQTSSPSEEAYTKEQWEGISATPKPEYANAYTTKYRMARGMASFFAIIGWLVLATGIVAGINSIGDGLASLAAAGGVILYGLLIMMIAQIVTATLDSADNTGEMLSLMKYRN